MRKSKKIESKLKARQDSFEKLKNSKGFKKPGSQNLKKQY